MYEDGLIIINSRVDSKPAKTKACLITIRTLDIARLYTRSANGVPAALPAVA